MVLFTLLKSCRQGFLRWIEPKDAPAGRNRLIADLIERNEKAGQDDRRRY
jgi:hypothetical protein